MSDVETALQLERAEDSQEKIPPDLSFDRLVKNRTLPPFSLNDFMDYLYYVEQSAEPLQFFLWYCDYVQRWSKLLPRQKALAPIWDSDGASKPRPRYITYSHKRARSDKMNKIMTIMEMASDDGSSETGQASTHTRDESSVSKASTTLTFSGSSIKSINLSVDGKEDWESSTAQPFREEVTRIAEHYIAPSAPRLLPLAPQDRTRCLEAVQHTTHPSALLPAFVVAEANLKGRSHPNFVRWSISNGSRPRIVFLRILGITLIVLGLGMDVFFVLSGLNHFFRILSIALLWPGLTITIAAFQGISILLHLRNARHLRPWEQFGELEGSAKEADADAEAEGKDADAGYRQHARRPTDASSASSSSSSSRIDPLRKDSLRTFGPPNNGGSGEPWVVPYAAKPLSRKVFEASVPVQNRSLQMLRDRAVFLAVVWGGVGSSAVAVASLFVPSGGLFL